MRSYRGYAAIFVAVAACFFSTSLASGEEPAPTWLAPESFAIDSFDPAGQAPVDPARLRQQILAYREAHEAEISTPAAEAEREDSVDLYSGLTGGEAIDLTLDVFDEQLDAHISSPTDVLLSSETEPDFRGDYSARINPPGPEDSALVVSNIPMRNQSGEVASGDLTRSGDRFTADEALGHISIPTDSSRDVRLFGEGISLEIPGNQTAAGHLESAGEKDLVLYPNTGTDTDTAVTALPNGIETFSVLRSEDSPEQVSFDFNLPDGASLSEENGGALISSDSGEPLLSILPPYAVDAQGSPVPTEATVSGSRIVVSIPHRGEDFAYPIMLDPTMTRDWWLNSTSPGYEGWNFLQLNSTAYQSGTTCPAGLPLTDCTGNPAGLYVSAVPGSTYPAGSLGYWYWLVPGGSSSSILNANLSLWRFRKGLSTSNNPYAFFTLGSSTMTSATDVGGLNYSLAGTQSGTRYLFTGLQASSSYTMPSGSPYWRFSRLGGFSATITDNDAPVVSAKSATPTGWLGDNTSVTLNATASDAGLGLGWIQFQVNGTWINSWAGWCTGNYDYPCPRTPQSTTSSFSTSSLPDGRNAVNVKAMDIVAGSSHEDNQIIWVSVDRQGPTISKSGPLTTTSDPGSAITLKIDDNAFSSDPAFDSAGELEPVGINDYGKLRSGAKSFKLYVDNQQVAQQSRTCDATFGSCRLGPVTLTPDLSAFADGPHDFKVVATDQLGNTTTSATWQRIIDRVPATISQASAPAGWQTGSTVPVSVDASNGSAGIARILVNRNGSTVKTETLSCSPSCPSQFNGTVQVNTSSLGEGDNTLMVYAVGPTGTQSEPKVVLTKIDRTAPAVTLNAPAWASTTQGVGVVASNQGSGIATVKVKSPSGDVIGQFDADCSAGCPDSIDNEVQFDASAVTQGTARNFELEVFDGSGRKISNTMVMGVERTAPALSSLGGTLPQLEGQQVDSNATKTVIVSGTDGSGAVNAGMKSLEVSDLAGTWTTTINCAVSSCSNVTMNVPLSALGDAEMEMQVIARDKAGNTDTKQVSFALDRNAPIIDAGTRDDKENGVWDSGDDLDFWLTVLDSPDESFVLDSKTVTLDGNPVTPEPCTTDCSVREYKVLNPGPGAHLLRVTATDKIGHSTEFERVFKLDSAAPEMTIDGDLTPDAEVGTGAQELHLSAQDQSSGDSRSGVASAVVWIDGTQVREVAEGCTSGDCELDETFEFAEDELATGVHKIEVAVTDLAGNVTEQDFTVTRRCDAASPSEVSTTGAISGAAAVANVEDNHPDVVAPSSQTEIGESSYQPTLVEGDDSLDSASTRESSELPKEPDGAVVVGEGTQSVCLVAGTLAEDADPALVVNGDSAIYPNTQQDTDTVVRPSVDGVESFEILRSEDAPENFHWELASSNDQSLSENNDGSVSVEISGADLPVGEAPDDVPGLTGQAATLVAAGKLPAGTVDAMSEPEVTVKEAIDQTVQTDPTASQVTGALTPGGPSGLPAAPSEPGRTPADMPTLLHDLAASAAEKTSALANESLDTYRTIETSNVQNSQVAATSYVANRLESIASSDVEIARIHQPEALDASQSEVPVSIQVDDDQIDMQVDHVGQNFQYPIAVDPEIDAYTTEIDWEPYPVYREEQYVSGSTISLRQIGWWDKKYCLWVNCVSESVANWFKVAGVYSAYLPGNGSGPLFEVLKKPVFSTRTVFDRFEYQPVVRKVKLTYTDPGYYLRNDNYDRGMNIVSFGRNSYTFGKNNHRFDSIHDKIGSKTAVLVPHYRVYGNSTIRAYGDTSTDEDIANGIRASRAAGMSRVILKPHIQPVSGAWRGEFNFSARNQFWIDNRQMLVGLCRLQQQQNVQIDGLVISTELSRVETDKSEAGNWKYLIRVLRNQCPGVKLYIATNWDMVLDRNNFPGWYRLLDYVGIDYYPDNSNVSASRMWLAAKQLNAAFPSLNGVLFSESGAYHEGGQPQQSYFAQMARGVMAGRNYNWFKGIWWYNKHVANDGDPSIAPDADESTVTAATMRFLCKTQTMLSDARCRAIIVPRK